VSNLTQLRALASLRMQAKNVKRIQIREKSFHAKAQSLRKGAKKLFAASRKLCAFA